MEQRGEEKKKKQRIGNELSNYTEKKQKQVNIRRLRLWDMSCCCFNQDQSNLLGLVGLGRNESLTLVLL